MVNSESLGDKLGKLVATTFNNAQDFARKAAEAADNSLSDFADNKIDEFYDAQHKRAMKDKEYSDLEASRKEGNESGDVNFDDWEKQAEIAKTLMPEPSYMPILRFFRGKPFKTVRNSIAYPIQRVSRGWDDRATWSLDTHLTLTLGQQLKHLAATAHGHPVGGKYSDYEQWVADLNKYGDDLIAYGSKWDADYTLEQEKELMANAKAAMQWVTDVLFDLWD